MSHHKAEHGRKCTPRETPRSTIESYEALVTATNSVTLKQKACEPLGHMSTHRPSQRELIQGNKPNFGQTRASIHEICSFVWLYLQNRNPVIFQSQLRSLCKVYRLDYVEGLGRLFI